MRSFSKSLALMIWAFVLVFPVKAEVSYNQVKESLEGRHWSPPKSFATLGEEEFPTYLTLSKMITFPTTTDFVLLES